MSSDTLVLRAEQSADLPTVLLVEDEKTTRESMRLFLKTCGYASIEASTVEHAVEALSHGISAAVLDVHLAGDRSGLEVLTPIRGRPELADIPVIVLTGGILTDAEEALIKQRHAYIFYKPEGCETIVSFLDRLRGRATGMAMPARVDEGLRHDFLAQTQRESWWLQSSLTTGLDCARARQIVHRWAGVGGTLGFAGISRRALDLQAMLDEPFDVTIERLRDAVNEIARLCAAVMETPLEPRRVLTDVIDALGGQLAGKKIRGSGRRLDGEHARTGQGLFAGPRSGGGRERRARAGSIRYGGHCGLVRPPRRRAYQCRRRGGNRLAGSPDWTHGRRGRQDVHAARSRARFSDRALFTRRISAASLAPALRGGPSSTGSRRCGVRRTPHRRGRR